tara:strand:+ start:70 stop:228 length:159 start_codon:yes stop_codon:yes gene_type:complete
MTDLDRLNDLGLILAALVVLAFAITAARAVPRAMHDYQVACEMGADCGETAE